MTTTTDQRPPIAAARTGRPIPTPPTRPFPDSGVFNGKARPKVEVQ